MHYSRVVCIVWEGGVSLGGRALNMAAIELPLDQSWSWVGSIHGLGWVGSKTMGDLTQSVSIDDVYKLNISYQCIKK